MQKFLVVALSMLVDGFLSHHARAENGGLPSAAEALDTVRLGSPELVAGTTPAEVEIVGQSSGRVIVAIPLTVKAVQMTDKVLIPAEKISSYVYLSRAGERWTMSGMRTAYPGFVRYLAYMAREAPKYDEEMRYDRLIALVGVSGLIATRTDQALMEHFRKNRDAFEEIRKSIAARTPDMPTRMERDESELGRLFTRTGIHYADHSVLPNDENANAPEGEDGNGCDGGGCFTLALTFVPPQFKVGYFHVDQPDRLPNMTLREYFVIRPLGDGWYFFRQN